jgi:glycogen debranching enzyme
MTELLDVKRQNGAEGSAERAGSTPPKPLSVYPSAHPEDEDRYHVSASSSLGQTHVLKHGDTFMVLDRFGDIHPSERGEQGLYHDGTKFLSRLTLKVQHHRPLLLSSSMQQNNLVLNVDLTNPDLYDGEGRLSVPHGTVHISRAKLVESGLYLERIRLSNYGPTAIELTLTLDFGADFVDIFEVRGTHREQRGERLPPDFDAEVAVLGYRGLDGVLRRTRLEFAPRPSRLDANSAAIPVQLGSHQSRELYVWVSCEVEELGGAEKSLPVPSFETALARSQAIVQDRDAGACRIQTSNQQFNEWLTRSQADLWMLVTDTPDGPYPYAGVPWFNTAFGRDGIWTALEVLWIEPRIAGGVLRFLSARQAMDYDAERDAEPGKILHELRGGEMAALREIPFGLYYGSIDSTPLYLVLAARYYEATADRALIESIWPNLLAATKWLERNADASADGFVKYDKQSKDGLVQQGWKDSNDSVFHRDGTLALGPIALCEVQGYAYAAWLGMSKLASALGELELATQFALRATALRAAFDAAFWCEDIGTYALALDAKGRPCRVKSSNPAHCLYSQIALPGRAARVGPQMLSPEMFSGWGIRTLATDEQRYNPMSYHNGSIWPHDNAIAAAGLAAYGLGDEAGRLLGAMFDAALFMGLRRLPELFCGFPRQAEQGPTLYPVACSPQAWASGSVFMLLKAVLGLEVDAVERRLTFRHTVLPAFLDQVEIFGLRVGGSLVDLRLHRYAEDVGVTVTRKTGKVEIVAVK